jgi:hypothetical protein
MDKIKIEIEIKNDTVISNKEYTNGITLNILLKILDGIK